jgi:hypothetical protein
MAITAVPQIYRFGYQYNFSKMRATRLKGKIRAENPEVDKLLLEIGKLFSGNFTKNIRKTPI